MEAKHSRGIDLGVLLAHLTVDPLHPTDKSS